jgi:hypothetical protein
MMLTFERIMCVLIMTVMLLMFIYGKLTILEWLVTFVLCNIWMATIDMRGD